jgi:hypothetical protein
MKQRSIEGRLFIALSIFDQLVDRRDVFGRGAPSLILSENNVFERKQVFRERNVVVGPLIVVFELGLEFPITAKLGNTHLALSSLLIFLSPYVLTPHRQKTLH